MPAASLSNVRAALLTTPRILVIEDRVAEQSLFQLGSIQGGCTFSHRRLEGDDGDLFRRMDVDLVVLNIDAAFAEAFSLCTTIANSYVDLPIIFTTSRGEDSLVIDAFESGAVDYLVKPFSEEMFAARVRTRLRLVRAPSNVDPIVVGELVISKSKDTVFCRGVPIDLRNREIDLLVYLCRRVGQVVTRRDLFADIWDLRWDNSSKTLDMHIHSLRRKLGDVAEISTVRGVGYRLEKMSEPVLVSPGA